MKSGNLNFLEPSGPLQAVIGLIYLYHSGGDGGPKWTVALRTMMRLSHVLSS